MKEQACAKCQVCKAVTETIVIVWTPAVATGVAVATVVVVATFAANVAVAQLNKVQVMQALKSEVAFELNASPELPVT